MESVSPAQPWLWGRLCYAGRVRRRVPQTLFVGISLLLLRAEAWAEPLPLEQRGTRARRRIPQSTAFVARASMTYQERIARDPAICAGQPTTRVLVRVVLGYLAHGEPVERILAEFPSLTEEDVRAVIAFAAASAAEDLPAPSPIPPTVKVA